MPDGDATGVPHRVMPVYAKKWQILDELSRR